MPYPLLSIAVAVAPSISPDSTGLPGAQVLEHLADGVDWWALIAAMVGIVVGAILWGTGRRTTAKPQAT